MNAGRVFLFTDQSSSSLLLLLTLPHHRHHHRQRPPTAIFTALSHSSPSYLRRRILVCGYRRRWDSNAESFRPRNFNFNFDSNSKHNNSENDDDDEYDDDDDDNDDDAPSDVDQWLEVLEEFIDGVYIFKAFKSVGWISPVIVLSWLLATGPKAFLMASALYLGQSALSFIFQKLSGKTKKNPKRNTKTKKKPYNHTAGNVAYKKEEESQGTRKRKKGYQSWVAANNVPVNKDGQSSYSFGGWDELDKQTEISKRPGSSSQAHSGSRRRQSIEKGKLSRTGRKSETPLLLRLLIAFFPFLSSWTKML